MSLISEFNFGKFKSHLSEFFWFCCSLILFLSLKTGINPSLGVAKLGPINWLELVFILIFLSFVLLLILKSDVIGLVFANLYFVILFNCEF